MSSATQSLARKCHFSCIHKYEVKEWTPEINRQTFGACYSQYGHGHNYELEAWFTGSLDQETGMIINLVEVDKILKKVTSTVDGKFLNEDISFFKTKVPTTENLLIYIKDELLKEIPSSSTIQLSHLRLYEGDHLWVDWHRN